LGLIGKNNIRQPSQTAPNGLRQEMNNKYEQPVFSHQEVINELLLYDSLLPMDRYTFSQYILQHYVTRHENRLSTKYD